MPKKIFLVDGSNHAFRVFFAMPRMTAGGLNTGALLGFANMLRSFEKEHQPDHVVVVFDKGPSFRVDLFDDYKGHRPEMPEELREQWPKIPELVEAWGYRCVDMVGWEADDIIGTLAKRWAGPDCHVWMVTGDKDFYQLVDDHISILDVMKKKEIRHAEVVERFGVGPERVTDVQGLAGDSSDNVPGVSGIGEKTASKYVQKYGDLESVIAHAAEIGGKRGAALAEEAEMARLSKVLVTMRLDVPLDWTLEDLDSHERDSAKLRELLVRYQFRSHLKALEEEGGAGSSQAKGSFTTIRSLSALENAAAEIRKAGHFCVDLETTSLDPKQAGLVGVCMSWDQAGGIYVPVGHTRGGHRVDGQLEESEAMKVIAPLLADSSLKKTGHNLKYDRSVLVSNGYTLEGISGDTLLADYLLEPERNRHKLDDLALRYLGHTMIPISELMDVKDPNATFAEADLDKAAVYGAEDAQITYALDRLLEPKLDELELRDVYEEIELPAMEVLSDMELTGIQVDTEQLKSLSVELGERIEGLEASIYREAGREFTINSPKQLQVILFEELGLTPIKKTKTGFSTDAETLKALASEHLLPKLILQYRELAKLKSTYVDALPLAVSATTGRIHTSFHQAVAATGRLASNNPNLQNIPSRTEEGRRVRSCFVAPEGKLLLSCDYSQIELRLLAHYCGEGPMVEAFRSGADIHRATAAEIFGVMAPLVTSQQRSAAKAINFGIVYGMSAFRLSNELKIPRREAQDYLDGYFARYPQVQRVHEELKEAARSQGFSTTLWGRKRRIPDINSSNKRDRAAAERIALNSPLQGSAADLIKIAMIRVQKRIRAEKWPARLLLQVHDELLLEVDESAIEVVSNGVKAEMEAAADLRVPIKVDAGWGPNWTEAH
ncbi:MAG: DNA polymerase I [Myxococcota bacterium]|nr:DNA polymerase I [Myxococcota bacterium]